MDSWTLYLSFGTCHKVNISAAVFFLVFINRICKHLLRLSDSVQCMRSAGALI